MTPLRYRPDLDAVLTRLRALYEQRSPELVLARMNVPSRVMHDFARQHAAGYCEYPDVAERTAFWDVLLQERQTVVDDAVPFAYLTELDQGLYGGLLGGEVRFLCDHTTGWISSMVPPMLENWSGLADLRYTTDHPWYRRYVEYLAAFVQAARGKFGVSHFICINHFNLAFELVGATNTYQTMVDTPAILPRVIELAHQLNAGVQQTFFEHIDLVAGGTPSFMAQWLPGRIVSESLDPFHMTSVDDFEQWGRAPVERMFAGFDGGIIHIHGNGRHLLRAASTLRGLKMIYLGDDHGYPLAFDVLGDIRRQVGNMPVSCLVKFAPFCRALEQHRLVGGVIYYVEDTPDVDTANRWMDRVRDYRATV